jgi:hypothetical protein
MQYIGLILIAIIIASGLILLKNNNVKRNNNTNPVNNSNGVPNNNTNPVNNSNGVPNNNTNPVNNTNGIPNNNTNPVNNTTEYENIQDYLLHVNGLVIQDAQGKNITLRGMTIEYNDLFKKANSLDNSYHYTEAWFQESDLQYLKEEGINVIDFHMLRLHQLVWDYGYPYINEEYYEKTFDIWVEWCERNKIYCILNIEGLSVPNPSGEFGNWAMPYWVWDDYGEKPQDLERQAQIIHNFWNPNTTWQEDEREFFLAFWNFTANRYKDNPFVMYAPFNEPLHHTFRYTTPEKINHLGKSYSKYITRIIDTINSAGTEKIVFVDRPYVFDVTDWNWSKNVYPINRTNIVWEAHSYVSPPTTIDDFKKDIDEFEDLFINKFERPVYIGEWGIDPPSHVHDIDWKTTIAEQKEYMEDKQLNWAFFSWSRLFGNENYSQINTQGHLNVTEVEEIWQIVFD